jgi:hypothetical protein
MKFFPLLLLLIIVSATIYVVKTNYFPFLMTILVLSVMGILLQLPNIFNKKIVRTLNLAIFISVAASSMMVNYGI